MSTMENNSTDIKCTVHENAHVAMFYGHAYQSPVFQCLDCLANEITQHLQEQK